jgi:type I restriction enzyme R subunit
MSYQDPDEAALELETIELFSRLGYSTANCFGEWESGKSNLGRETKTEVILRSRLLSALTQLNPDLTPDILTSAIETLSGDRSALSLVNANRDNYKLLKEGVEVTYRNEDDEETETTVRIIDWQHTENNDFFLASQFWIAGETYIRRTDLLGFVNGIPLIFIELKSHKEAIEKAFDDNFTDYLREIPQLFWHNGLVLLSNGSQAKIGSITSDWGHFYNWKRINNEGETGIISIETLILGTCEKNRLIDIIENFILYHEKDGSVNKIIAQNHQYLGVNNAIANVQKVYTNSEQGRKSLGVFWHTQGSGKSFSMQFFSQKIFRKLVGNWKILVITDREDLDDQIYENFAQTGAVTDPEKTVKADSAEHLKQLLKEDHHYIFTLIQKFRTKKGETYPQLSDNAHIIVMADEAHRSQYDLYSMNLRLALPNAAFIGFTGTPLIAGEEEATRREFGDYVSIYNFRQSIDDGATVPLFYENRIPQLALSNSDLNEDITDAIEAATLDQDQEDKLAQEFSRQYHLITREPRLDAIAQDIVSHFLNRGYQGKAMVISIDRFTAVKMYNKVQHYWQQTLTELKTQRNQSIGSEKERLTAQIEYLEETDMSVIISSGQNEEDKFQKKGLTIKPHRARMAKEKPALDEKFKDTKNPLRIVFVCAMWMTGFDVPSCSTIYLDKPMKNHTLMQTIARANRVFTDKNNGLIVDYIGVFNNLQDALKIYGKGSGNSVNEEDSPIQAKAQLVEILKEKIKEFDDYLNSIKIDLSQLKNTLSAFKQIGIWDNAVDAILVNANSKQAFLDKSNTIIKIFKAILPDTQAQEFSATIATIKILKQKIAILDPKVNIDEIKAEIETILDSSIGTYQYVIPDSQELIDLSKLDIEALKQEFSQGYQNTLVEKLQNALSSKINTMIKLNKSRMNYYDKFQKMIDDYNSATHNIEVIFNQLIELAQDLDKEDQRAIAENLDEEKLALFDLLIDPDLTLSDKDQKKIKKIAEDLLNTLKQEKLTLDWRKKLRARAAVKVVIADTLDQLPESYTEELYTQKCEKVYQHIYESYADAQHNIYSKAA